MCDGQYGSHEPKHPPCTHPHLVQLPKKRVFVLLCITISESFAINMLFPFAPDMVRSFHMTEVDTEIGYYVGLIASSFTVRPTLPFGRLLRCFGQPRWQLGLASSPLIGSLCVFTNVVAVCFEIDPISFPFLVGSWHNFALALLSGPCRTGLGGKGVCPGVITDSDERGCPKIISLP